MFTDYWLQKFQILEVLFSNQLSYMGDILVIWRFMPEKLSVVGNRLQILINRKGFYLQGKW